MESVGARDLRNNTRSVLSRVEQGESVVVTIDGRPVARLEPVARRPRWLARDEFLRRFLPHQADPGLADDLADLTGGETTDDLRS